MLWLCKSAPESKANKYYKFQVFWNRIQLLRSWGRFFLPVSFISTARSRLKISNSFLLQPGSTSSFRADSREKNLTRYLRYRIMSWKCCKRTAICSKACCWDWQSALPLGVSRPEAAWSLGSACVVSGRLVYLLLVRPLQPLELTLERQCWVLEDEIVAC